MIDLDGIDRDELIKNLTSALEVTTKKYAAEKEKAITAEKALEILTTVRFTTDCDKCAAFEHCAELSDSEYDFTCYQVFAQWAIAEARGQG